MKSNDALLRYMIAWDEAQKNRQAKLNTDEVLHTPKQIKVKPNEVVYLHFFHSNCPNFSIEIQTATETLTLNDRNTLSKSNNTILKAVSDIYFKSRQKHRTDFFVQLLRIQY